MKKTHHGSCHCGAIQFECEVDLDQGTSKCNCSICTKTRFWKAIVKTDAFRLVRGDDALSEYQFGSGAIHHMFCKHCGVKPFGRGHVEALGSFYAVNVACLDDATSAEMVGAPVQYEDGRNNDWGSTPAETRLL